MNYIPREVYWMDWLKHGNTTNTTKEFVQSGLVKKQSVGAILVGLRKS